MVRKYGRYTSINPTLGRQMQPLADELGRVLDPHRRDSDTNGPYFITQEPGGVKGHRGEGGQGLAEGHAAVALGASVSVSPNGPRRTAAQRRSRPRSEPT